MKVLAVKINWREDCDNDPVLQLLIDRFPPFASFLFEKNGPIYYAELGGNVKYYAWHGKPDRGFSGRHFPITMKSGEEVTLEGPWSSRPGEVHKRGFGPCVHVSITDDPDAFERGHTLFTGDVTLTFAQKAIAKHLPDVELVKVEVWGEYSWIPKRRGQPLKESIRVRAIKKGE